jgi:hypothetical protein
MYIKMLFAEEERSQQCVSLYRLLPCAPVCAKMLMLLRPWKCLAPRKRVSGEITILPWQDLFSELKLTN